MAGEFYYYVMHVIAAAVVGVVFLVWSMHGSCTYVEFFWIAWICEDEGLKLVVCAVGLHDMRWYHVKIDGMAGVWCD